MAASGLGRCWPAVVLLAALATLFLFFVESGPLHRAPVRHDHITFNHLTVAKNLSAEHGWLGFYSHAVDDEGELRYVVYNRFPPLGYFLIRLATETTAGALWDEIQAARLLMLALYAGAAMLAYLALVRLIGRRPLALAATLTAFGSYAGLRACDMVATEGTVDLFGTMLAFHGIAHYYRRPGPGLPPLPDATPRVAQLLAKTGTALLLGWHVGILLAVFAALGTALAAAERNWRECRRFVLVGGFALLFTALVLAQNFVREYFALQGQVPVAQLPTLESLWDRSILDDLGPGGGLVGQLGQAWALAVDQLRRAGLALLPFAATRIDIWWSGWPILGALGISTVLGAAYRVWRRAEPGAARRHVQAAILALVPLALMGFGWAFAMHDSFRSYRQPRLEGFDVFEAMFHVGVPLALFSLLALAAGTGGGMRGRPRRVAAGMLTATICLAFVASAFEMGRLGRDADAVADKRAQLADVDAIRQRVGRGTVFVQRPRQAGVLHRWRTYLAGHVLIRNRGKRARFAEFAVAGRIPDARTLTPDNHFYFLYDMAEYTRHCAPPRLCMSVGFGSMVPLPRR